jgi:colicin import membrane protein
MKYLTKLPIIIFLITSCLVWANDEEKASEIRDRNLKRMQGMAGQEFNSLKNDSPNYAEKIRIAIKQNIVFKIDPKEPKPNLQTIVLVECDEEGLIRSRTIIKSSGNGAWDASVINALDRTQRIPTDTNGKAPPKLEISFRPFN